MKLIDKEALVLEIEKLKGQLIRGACASQISMQTYCKEEAYKEILSILDALEVKELDLQKEYINSLIKKRIVSTIIGLKHRKENSYDTRK